ncbi:MAG: HAD family hydrolase [Caldilineaceae bacterium]
MKQNLTSRHLLAVCIDSGDTLVDEGTEVKDADLVVQRAELIPGASELLYAIKRLGYPLALVADGPVGSFQNIYSQHDLLHLFDVMAISGKLGVEKPDARMFHAALEALGIPRRQYTHTLMVGNNLERDIKGANALDIISVWIDWAPRRSKIPADASEVPQYTIKTPLELLDVIEQIEAKLGSVHG